MGVELTDDEIKATNKHLKENGGEELSEADIKEMNEVRRMMYSFDRIEFKDDAQKKMAEDSQKLFVSILNELVHRGGEHEDFKNFYFLLRELHHLLVLGSSEDRIKKNSKEGLKFLAISAESLVVPNRQVTSDIDDCKRKVLETLPKDFKFGAEGGS